MDAKLANKAKERAVKGQIAVEFEYETFDDMMVAMRIITSNIEDVKPYIEVTRVTATSFDSEDKPFMTETPIGSTPQ